MELHRAVSPQELRSWVPVILCVLSAAGFIGCGDDNPGRPRAEHWEVAGIWGGFDSGPGRLSFPLDLCVDSQGNILVADTGNHLVQKFSPDGAFLGNTQETLRLDYPMKIHCDDQGRVLLRSGLTEDPAVDARLLVLDPDLRLDRVMDFSYTFLTSWHDMLIGGLRPLVFPAGKDYDVVGFNLDGDVLFRTAPDVPAWVPAAGSCGADKVFVWNDPTRILHVLDLHSMTWSQWDGQLVGVEDVYAGEGARVFVACRGISGIEGGIGGVYEFTAGGEFVEKVTNEQTAVVRDASAVTMDRSGALYVLNWGDGEIVKLVRVAE